MERLKYWKMLNKNFDGKLLDFHPFYKDVSPCPIPEKTDVCKYREYGILRCYFTTSAYKVRNLKYTVMSDIQVRLKCIFFKYMID